MKKILVVEDDPLNLQILSDYLGAQGYATVAASTGPEGMERFLAEQPDLLLVDVQIPRENGYQLCARIKGSVEGRSTPVLLMSAVYTDDAHAAEFRRRGLEADGYLVKPFELAGLLERVRALIGEA